MIDQQQARGKKRYVLVGMFILVAGIGGLIVGRSLGQPNNQTSDIRSRNEITLPTGGLLFKSREGKLVAKLDHDAIGASLVLYNNNEQPIVLMGATQSGEGLIGLANQKGGSVLNLSGREEGGSIVLLSQNRGKRVVRLSANDDGGSIEVNGPTGDEAVVIDTEDLGSTNKGRIDVFESTTGKVLWTSPMAVTQRKQ